MADQVTDNRTLIASGEVADPGVAGPTDGVWENLGGSTAALDTEISYDTYTGSIGDFCTTTRDGTFWNDGAVGLFSSGDHAYFLINCGIVSLLATKAAGGTTFRVTGATATDWAEFELFGADEWPNAFDGGWVQVVVDIDELLANPTNFNGSPPTVGNIQRAGFTFITATVMPRMADNFWVGGFAILPANTPAIIVEGRDGGATDWDWDSIRSVAAVQLSAVIKPGPGGTFVGRGPIQFAIDDTSTHAFTEINKTFLWDTQEVMLDGFYGLSALGNSGGTTNIKFGLKTGSGDDATGAQGGAIQAAATAARWNMDFNDPNIDSANFYGSQLIHGGVFLLDDPAISFISSSYIDCTSALISNSEQLRIQVIDANTADAVAFMTTDDMTDIVFSSFFFSDGHAIELTTPRVATQTSKGNLFAGYGTTTSNDAQIFNNSGGAVTINATDNSDISTFRDGTSASTIIVNSVTLSLTGIQTDSEVSIVNLDDVINFDKSLSSSEQIEGGVTKATIADGGSGYTNGTQTLTVVGGTGSAAQVSVEVVGNVVDSINSITVPGAYTDNPPTPSTTTGGGGTGATLRLTISGTHDFAYDAGLGVNVAIIVFHLNFKEVRIEQILPASNSSIPIQQTTDRVFRNP